MSSTNVSSLVTNATAASSVLSSLALVIPLSSNPGATKGYQPLSPLDSNGKIDPTLTQPTALLFHYEGDNSVGLKSDITDHFVEDNTAVEDQIALRPEIVSVTGFIGELNNVLPTALQVLQNIANNLLLVESYQPALTVTALVKLNQAKLLYDSAKSVANSAVAAWSSLASSADQIGTTGTFTVGSSAFLQNKQQAMFQQLYGYWYNRVLFNVQTPWAIFTNMAIDSMDPTQDETTRMITSFKINFKKIRTASSQTTSTNLSAGRTQTQSSSLVNLGTTSGIAGSSLGSGIAAIA